MENLELKVEKEVKEEEVKEILIKFMEPFSLSPR